MKKSLRLSPQMTPILWIAATALTVALLFARVAFSDLLWLTIVVSVLLTAVLAALIQINRAALRSRSVNLGAQSIVTVVLTLAILGVVNFLAARYPAKFDVTANRIHTLSEQSTKIVKELKQPIKAILWAKGAEREKYKSLLDNFRGLNPLFEVEHVDPDREPTRAKDAGIKRYGTLQIKLGDKESKVEDPTEEKLTNALIKLVKNKTSMLCSITGHGEKSMTSNAADGYEMARKQLSEQSYSVKDFNLVQDTGTGKIQDTCDALVVLGPTRAFFDAELKLLKEYLASGGRAVIALDLNLKGAEAAPELLTLLASWSVKVAPGLIVDPLSKALGSDAAVPILATFNKEHAITKDFQTQCFFPFARPLEAAPQLPTGLAVSWLGQSTAKSFVVTNIKELASGQARIAPGTVPAARNVAMAVEGKAPESKATRNTRMVVFGTSQFATNQWARFGGNLDFFMNAIAWALEDESMISIRTKEDGVGRIELSGRTGNLIGLLTVFLIPLLIAGFGVSVWYYRRRK